MSVRRTSVVLLLGGAALSTLVRCREPTYVDLVLTTDIPCERVRGVAITVGSLGPLEQRLAATSTLQCAGGSIGDISVVPSGSDDGEFGVRVVMGIDRGVESCVAPDYGDGCVVARRGLRFVPHEPLTLPVVLRQICNGIPCGPLDTCVKGVCRSATIKDPSACKGGGCGEDTLGPPSTGDGGAPPALATYCGTSPVDLAAPWPMAGGCPTRAGRSSARGPQQAKTPVVLDPGANWAPVLGAMHGQIVVDAKNRAMGARLVGVTDSFAAQPLGGGALAANVPGVFGTAGECVLLAAGHLRCFGTDASGDVFDADIPTDTLVPKKTTPPRFKDGLPRQLDAWAFTSSGVIYAVTTSGAAPQEVGMIDASGVKWEALLNSAPFPIALSRDGRTAYFHLNRSLDSIDVATGVTTSNLYPASVTGLGPPTVAEDDSVLVVVNTASGPALRRFAAGSGQQLDSTNLASNAPATPWSIALGNSRSGRLAYVYAPGNPVTAVRYPGGGVAWTAQVHASSLLVAADEVIYLATDAGDRVVALRPDDGSILWQAPLTSGANPTIALGADGALCVGTVGGGIACYPR